MDAPSEDAQSDALGQETKNGLFPHEFGLQDPSDQVPPSLSSQDACKVPQAPVPNPRSVYAVSSQTEDPATAQGGVSAPSAMERPTTRLAESPAFVGHAKPVDVSLLLKELDILRDTNTKLREALSERDLELQSLKVELELQEAASEAGLAERTAALVEEVYLAQRERDQAVMARLRLANEERDDAIIRAKRLEQSLRELEDINPEEQEATLQELLARVQTADSGTDIERSAAILLDRVQRTKERKREITAEEMSAVLAERDAALAQCKRLEEELRCARERTQKSAPVGSLAVETPPARAQKVQLMSLQQDRDQAVEEYKRLEEELQTLRVYYSLHQSLSQEVILKEQFQVAIHTYEEALKNREQVALITQKQNEALSAQAQQVVCESATLHVRLQQAESAAQAAEEKVQRLERLVDVLRKKVGTGTLRTMI
ncbi:mirror-image polydactyly gene 1 protein [Lissotriton helveticus]